jgi:hypothetical protein
MPYEVLDDAPKGRFEPLPAEPTATRSDRIAKGLRDPIDGGAQLLTNLLPAGLVQAGNRANNWLADKTGLVGRLPEGGVNQQVKDAETAYQASRGPDAGFDGYRVLGNVLSPANLALAARAPQAVSMAGRVGQGVMTGAGSAALNPVASDDYWTDKGTQVAVGAVGGGLTPMATAGARSLISPAASTNPQVALLKNAGITPTIGQSLGGAWNRAEEKAMSLPIMGDAIAAARGRAREQFNRAAINRATAPVGVTIDEAGQAGVQRAGNALSQAYDDALSKVGKVELDAQFSQDFGALQKLAQGMTPQMRARFNSTVSDVLGSKTPDSGVLLPGTFKQIDSKLGQEAAKFGKSSDPFQKELGDAYAQLQALLKQQAGRTSPEFGEALSKADRGWANLVRVEGAAKAAQNSDGLFTPGQLNQAIRQADQSTRGRSVARGTALMQDLGNAGQQVLGNVVPNSGTADRLMWGGAGLGAYFVDPLIPAGLLTGAAMYSRPVQGLLSTAVTQRPQAAQTVGNTLLKASPGLVPLGAQVGLGLLN